MSKEFDIELTNFSLSEKIRKMEWEFFLFVKNEKSDKVEISTKFVNQFHVIFGESNE